MSALQSSHQILVSSEKRRDFKLAGSLYIFSGSAFILLITLLESLYPGYSVHTNAISDLLAIGTKTSLIGEPVAFVIAVSWIAGGYLLYRKTGMKTQLVLSILPGTGLLLAVLSPENVNVVIHSIGAILAFVIGSLVLILSYRSITTAFRYFSLIFGIISLVSVIVEFGAYYSPFVQHTLGPGGAERIIIYPIIIWLIGYGNYLLGKVDQA
jgi:hypothetical membrane protein